MSSLVTEPRTGDAGQIGDRLAAFTVCLPADPAGPVLIYTGRDIAEALKQRFTDATVVTEGCTLPAPGTVALLVMDTRVGDENLHALLMSTVAPDGAVARIGRSGRWTVYPTLERPEQLWMRGWPMPTVSGRRRQWRRNLGLTASGIRGVPRLEVAPLGAESVPSLAELVAEDVGRILGRAYELTGVVTAGVTVLRLTSAVDELAVRLSCTDLTAIPHVGEAIARDVPGLRGMVLSVVARGRTANVPWVASPWLPRTDAPRGISSPVEKTQVLDRMVTVLAARPLGQTFPGWSQRWVQRTELLPPAERSPLIELLGHLEQAPLPTGWCHGDPWAGNVRYRGSRGYIIDWDNAVSDAPLGLDRLLIELLHRDRRSAGSTAQICRDLIDDPSIGAVGGRMWRTWDRRTRIALLAAAHLLYLRNRAFHDLGQEGLEAELTGLRELTALAADTPAAPPAETSTAHGAGWLGLGAGIVKASQTIVLLVLAALLAPSAIGILSIGALVLNVISTLSDLGSSTALVYWRGNAERAARSALTLALTSAALLTTAAWVIAPWLSTSLRAGSSGTEVIRGLALCLPFISVAGVSQELLRRDLAFKRRVLPDIVGAVAGGAASVAFALHGQGAMSLVLGQLLQYSLVMALCWVMRPPISPGWDRDDASGLVSYGSGLAGANVVQLLMLNVDYIIVARFLGTPSLGVYSMAFRLAYMPYLLIAVVLGGAAFAHLCRAQGDAVGEGLMRTLGNTLMLVVPMYLGIILLAPDLTVLGHQWSPAVPALCWLAVYGLALSMLNLCMVGLNAVSRTRDTFVLNVVHLVVLVALLLALTHRGVTMVGIAQAVAGGTALLLAIILIGRRISGLHLRLVRGRIVAVLAGAAAMTGTWALCEAALAPQRGSLADLLTDGPLLLLAFGTAVAALDPEIRLRVSSMRGGTR